MRMRSEQLSSLPVLTPGRAGGREISKHCKSGCSPLHPLASPPTSIVWSVVAVVPVVSVVPVAPVVPVATVVPVLPSCDKPSQPGMDSVEPACTSSGLSTPFFAAKASALVPHSCAISANVSPVWTAWEAPQRQASCSSARRPSLLSPTQPATVRTFWVNSHLRPPAAPE
jgi:hypothetical protein